jgi:flagellar hook assembly protein FlgD
LQRLLTTVTLVGLLVATAAAFAVTERLKLTKSPLMPGTRVSKTFSPTCGCARGKANIVIKLRRADVLTVKVLDSSRRPVRILAAGVFTHRGFSTFRWDGRTDLTARAPDGTYQAEVHLAQQHQTILLPNKIQLDTTVPVVRNAVANREEFSPDGDKQADFVRIAYQLSKPAHVQLYLDGSRILSTFLHTTSGSVSWNGQAHGQTLPAGEYTLELGATDLAGNTTPVKQRWPLPLRIRYIRLASPKIHARAGAHFVIGVSTDARRYSWQLGKRRGVASSPVLRLLAPGRKGRYTLTVSEHGHLSRAAVFVR